MNKKRKPSQLEIDVHSQTGGRVDYVKVFHGSAYPNQNYTNPKAPNFKGKCTIEINGQETELDLAIWNRDYGLSIVGTQITLVDILPTKKQQREYE